MSLKDAGYHKTILNNGIRIVSEKIPAVRSISIGVWLTVGSRDETAANNGISHFIEHMVFKGTSNRSAADIAQSLESVGGHLNAFTGKEQTCYFAHILDEDLPIAVDVISDFLINSLFLDDEMEKEKRVILEELNNIEETPEELIHEHFVEDLFPNHSLGLSIIGKRENIQTFSVDDIHAYLNQNYTSDRIVIAAAGNVDHKTLVQLVKRYLGQTTTSSKHAYEKPCANSREQHVIENGAIQAHVCLGTQSYSYKNNKKYALLVLNTLLGSGMSSRLFQNIREKYGLAYSIYSFVDFLIDTGLFGVYIGTTKDNVKDSIELIFKELKELKDTAVSDEELERTKSQLKGNLMLGLESTSSRMNRLAKMEIYLDEYVTLDDTLSEIEKVSTADLLDVANELFDEKKIYTTILKPKDN